MLTTRGRGARALPRHRAMLLMCAVALLAACSGGSKSPSPVPSPTPSATQSAGGLGGTLHVVGSADPAGLDPVAAASPQAAVLLRLTTRQLYTWTTSQFPSTAGTPASPRAGQTSGAVSPIPSGSPTGSATASATTSAPASASATPSPTASATAPVRPVPDLAARQPRITDGGRTYTIDMRGGAKWDVPGGRQVTATDVVRGIKRLCNPVDPSPLLPYFTGTIQGLAHFCAGFAAVAKTPTAMSTYLESTPLPGVHADNDMTVSFHLIAPARDFLNLLTLPASSPVPTEMLAYVPDSADYRSHLVSDGPYRITSYTPGKQILLRRNTQWSPGADPARTAYVDGVQVDFGVPPAQQTARLADGRADLALDAAGAAPESGTAAPGETAGSVVVDRGTVVNLFFNLSASTAGDAHGVLSQPTVRKALQRCVDGAEVVRAFGGPPLASASHQVLVPGSWGYQPQNLYQAGKSDETAACRMGLALAGTPQLSLTYLAVGRGRDPAVVAAITEGFARAGIALRVVDGGNDEQVLTDGRTHWDVALLLTTPDWPSENARSYVVQRLTPLSPGNVGMYQSTAVQRGLASAAAATDDTVAAHRWAALDTTIMRDPPYVPLAALREDLPRSTRIGGWSYLPTLDNADPTQIFLPVEAAPSVSVTPSSPQP